MKIWQVYWRNRQVSKNAVVGYVKANSRNEAYEIAKEKLQKECEITAVYEASESWITPQSLTINFMNIEEYTLF